MTSAIQAVFESWSFPVPATSALVLLAAVYGHGWFRLRSALPNTAPVWRLVAFIGGLLSLWAAIGSPLEEFDDVLLSAHMVQHILLMVVAPPLLLLGAPAMPFLHGLPRPFVRSVMGPVLRWPPARQLGRILTDPAFCWFGAMAALIGWHFPPAFELALRSDFWHRVEHICFFSTSILFWWPVVQPWPGAARLPRWSVPLYLFFGMLVNDALSAVLAFGDHVLYPSYTSSVPRFQISSLDDQARAGALMWVFGTFVYLIPAVVLTLQILEPARLRHKKGITLGEGTGRLEGSRGTL
jgi:cytochrome c oxidase assembly factor CtaG